MLLLKLFLGVYGDCYRVGTKLNCTGTFKNKPYTVETDVNACQNPVKIDIKLKILGLVFTKKYTGDQDIPLLGLTIDKSTVFLLNVNVKPLSIGDQKITVSCHHCQLWFLFTKMFFLLHNWSKPYRKTENHLALPKICGKTGFCWSYFSHSLCGKMRVSENPYYHIFNAMWLKQILYINNNNVARIIFALWKEVTVKPPIPFFTVLPDLLSFEKV